MVSLSKVLGALERGVDIDISLGGAIDLDSILPDRIRSQPVTAAYDDGGDLKWEGHDTIQSAVDACETAGGGSVMIGPTYGDADTWPVTISSKEMEVKSLRGKKTLDISTGGAGAFEVQLENSRPPGVLFKDLSILDSTPGSSGSPTVDVIDSSYVSLENVDIDHANNGGARSYSISGDGVSAPNSNTLKFCSAERIGGASYYVGADAHSTLMYGCRSKESGAEGVFLDGLSNNVSFVGGSIEDAAGAGFRCRVAVNVTIEDTYFENNGNNTTGGQQTEIICQNAADNVYVNNCWFNGDDDGLPRLYNQDTSGHVEFNQIRYNDDYDNIFDLNQGTFTAHRQNIIASGTGSPNVWLIDGDMGRVYDESGVIVAAGSNNGGNDAISGVDTGTVTGDRFGDKAIADGTTITPAGTLATWDGANWQT